MHEDSGQSNWEEMFRFVKSLVRCLEGVGGMSVWLYSYTSAELRSTIVVRGTSQVLKRPYKETRGRTRRILGVYIMNLRVDSGRSSVVDFICRYGPRRIILYTRRICPSISTGPRTRPNLDSYL